MCSGKDRLSGGAEVAKKGGRKAELNPGVLILSQRLISCGTRDHGFHLLLQSEEPAPWERSALSSFIPHTCVLGAFCCWLVFSYLTCSAPPPLFPVSQRLPLN